MWQSCLVVILRRFCLRLQGRHRGSDGSNGPINFQVTGLVAVSGRRKDKPFASRFQALGVEFDLSTVGSGFFSVSNTTSRRDELSEKIASIIQLDELEPKVAESLRSRLLFAEGQLYGRFAKLALQRIGPSDSDRSQPSLLEPK